MRKMGMPREFVILLLLHNFLVSPLFALLHDPLDIIFRSSIKQVLSININYPHLALTIYHDNW